jgi:hypothetical protein
MNSQSWSSLSLDRPPTAACFFPFPASFYLEFEGQRTLILSPSAPQ